MAFLPENYSLAAACLEIIEGRDVIALERTNSALVVYLDDTLPGATPYEFKIHFHPAAAKPAETRAPSAATLKITAQIDGSDLLKITAQEAVWTHRTYGCPDAVSLNGVPWDLRQTNVLMNAGTNSTIQTARTLMSWKFRLGNEAQRARHREGTFGPRKAASVSSGCVRSNARCRSNCSIRLP